MRASLPPRFVSRQKGKRPEISDQGEARHITAAATKLRQHEDGGGDDLRRQGPAVQSPLPPDVLASPRRAGRLHAGRRAGRKARSRTRSALVRERFFTPRLRFKSYDELNAWLLDKCLVWAKAHAHPEQARADDLGGLRRGTAEADPISRTLRRIPRAAGLGVEDLPRALRQQQVFGQRQRRRPSGRHPRLRRPDRHPPGRAGCRGAPAQRSAAARRCTIPGITCRCWRASPARSATARRSRTGCCRRRWTASGASSQVRTTATGRWSRFSPQCSPTDLPAVEAACAQALAEDVHSADVVINILARRRDPGPAATIRPPPLCNSAMRRSPTAPDTINSGAPDHGTNRSPRHDGRLKLYGMRSRLRRDAGHRAQAQARAAALRRRSPASRDLGEAGALDQVPDHGLQAAARQGPRRLRLQGHADQRGSRSRSRRRRLHRPAAQRSC